MKKRLTLITLSFVAFSVFSQPPKNNFKIKGHVDNINIGNIFISYNSSNDGFLMDSTKIINGNFEFEGKIPQPEVAYLKLTNLRVLDSKTVNFFLEPGLINIELGDPFSIIKVEGSKTNNEFLEWKNADISLKKKFSNTLNNKPNVNDTTKQKRYKDSLILYNNQKFALEYAFIKSHPQSYAALYLLNIHYRNYPPAVVSGFYKNIGVELQTSIFGKELSKHLSEIEPGIVGSVAANIADKDFINNIDFNLASLKGKYVIIDFWGSWCLPCLKLLPDLVEEHNKYKNKNIAFISVAYDHDSNQTKCKNIVNKTGMNWINIWQSQDKKGVNDITTMYNIRAYPTFIVIDPNGKIIERGEAEVGLIKCKNILEKL